MGFDLAHGVAIVDALAAIRAFVEFEIGNRIRLPFEATGPISPDPLNSAAAAGGTSSNSNERLAHALEGPL